MLWAAKWELVQWEQCKGEVWVECKVAQAPWECKIIWVVWEVPWEVDLVCRVTIKGLVDQWECKVTWVECNLTHLLSNNNSLILPHNKIREDSRNKMKICHRF